MGKFKDWSMYIKSLYTFISIEILLNIAKYGIVIVVVVVVVVNGWTI